MTRPKTAIVLFNLGGPDSLAAVGPFLRNLFTDPAILRVPFFIRPWLARRIARARVAPATENYQRLGGRSPLLDLTEQQARALEAALPELEARCFIAMRYWHPFSLEAAAAVKAWDPDEVVLLPLYPQYSTTTTGSSLDAWREAAVQVGLVKPVTTLCCYHGDPGFIAATAALVRAHHDQARAALPAEVPLRVLFSAHGLPEIIIRGGDPYQFQVESTVAAVVQAMELPALDHVVCYQSRATPQQWIEPATDAEVARAAADGVALLVVPIAFVSEHVETLVELDVEYAELAHRLGVPGYFRVPTQNADPGFIAALSDLVWRARAGGSGLCSFAGGTTCPAPFGACPHVRGGAAFAPAAPGEDGNAAALAA
ncbi:MAG: ferrochelatase [Alphaproteobacteria bacterium]|nr:ferrochelatase [Alphaproteobacteria bacterium]